MPRRKRKAQELGAVMPQKARENERRGLCNRSQPGE